MRHIKPFAPAAVEPSGHPPFGGCDSIRTDRVYVVYTTMDDTLAAVRAAGGFAEALAVPVTLVHVREVPYASPLEAPCGVSPVEADAFLASLRAERLDVLVRVYLCRDERRAIPMAFKPHSLIVVAGQRSWRPTEAERWRRALEAAGHFVVFLDTARPGALRARHESIADHESTSAAA